MLAVSIINIVAVFLTYLSKYYKFRYGFELAIILLICFFGIRYNYGNDYPAYYAMFADINRYQIIDYSTDSTSLERGWKFLNRIFAPLGFWSLVFCLTAFHFVSIYYIIKKYIDKDQQFVALFLYLFTTSLMLTMLSMMRQCLAMSIILWAIPFILKKNYIKSALLIYLAAQFHQSAYLLFILLICPMLGEISKKKYVFGFIMIFIFLWLMKAPISNLLMDVVQTYFNKYDIYLAENSGAELSTGVGVIYYSIVFLCLLVYDPHDKSPESFFMKMMAVSIIFIPLGLIVQLISRLAAYFQLIGIFGLASIPTFKSKYHLPTVMLFSYVFFVIYGYISFFFSDVWTKSYMEYHTIFNAY